MPTKATRPTSGGRFERNKTGELTRIDPDGVQPPPEDEPALTPEIPAAKSAADSKAKRNAE
ncbi:MAG TPA: hypothetical protein DEB47_04860 [Citreicella sp.]|nr:hypothetical protein [Citreicella sp.]